MIRRSIQGQRHLPPPGIDPPFDGGEIRIEDPEEKKDDDTEEASESMDEMMTTGVEATAPLMMDVQMGNEEIQFGEFSEKIRTDFLL